MRTENAERIGVARDEERLQSSAKGIRGWRLFSGRTWIGHESILAEVWAKDQWVAAQSELQAILEGTSQRRVETGAMRPKAPTGLQTYGYWGTRKNVVQSIRDAQGRKSPNKIILILCEVLPSLVVDRNDRCLGKVVCGFQSVVGIHGQMKGTSHLRGSGE